MDLSESISNMIGLNLKRIRLERKLSMDHVSQLTGVSKSMIGQIERGVVNPTISTVWKISNGLKISFTTLLTVEKAELAIIKKSDIYSLLGEDSGYRNYPVFTFDAERRFETYIVEIDPESALKAEAHPANTQEFITVFRGSVCIDVNDKQYTLNEGDSIHFKADSPHCYTNHSLVRTTLSMIIFYP